MNATIKWIVILVFLAGCNRKENAEKKSFSDQVDSLMMSIPDFSGVVLVADNGKPVYHKSFGLANAETKMQMDTTSVFELASVSKQFTALLVAMLQEENKLNYDDPVEKYLPNLPYPNITIRQLLNHTSGLPDYQKLMDEQWDKTKVANNDDIISYLKKFHPPSLFKPGDKYEYSNTGYVLLGSIVEKASGKEFILFCNEKIFRPLGMTSTNIRSKAQRDSIANFARGYIWVPERKKYVLADSFPSSNYTFWLGGRKGTGRISSTTSDLLKWDQALRTEKFVTPKTLNEIFSPARLSNDSLSNYGFGWMLRNDPRIGKIVFHTGDNPGYKTEIIRYIDKSKTMIVLCNNAHEKFDETVKAIEALLFKN